MLLAALKDRKSSYDNMKKNMRFKKLQLNYISNQKNEQTKKNT